MKEMRSASIELAAYFVTSAERGSITMKGFPDSKNG